MQPDTKEPYCLSPDSSHPCSHTPLMNIASLFIGCAAEGGVSASQRERERARASRCCQMPEAARVYAGPRGDTRMRGRAASRRGESETAAVSLSTRMGCNLCSLQKREEHYKLLYEISQVRHATRPLPETDGQVQRSVWRSETFSCGRKVPCFLDLVLW